MCGRYATSKSKADISDQFEAEPTGVTDLQPDFNVAPTKQVPAIVMRTKDDAPQRQLRTLRWGLVPFWAKDPAIGNRMINARLETAASKPSFRKAFAVRRALIPADGYYEWYVTQQRDAKGKPKKQPFFIRPRDGRSLAMAGLYEIWRDRSRPDDDPDAFLWSCTVLTTSAEDSVGRIHDRAPLLLEPEAYGEWLDPEVAGERAHELLVPATPGRLEAYPVSTGVNNVRNNGPELLDPIEPEPPLD